MNPAHSVFAVLLGCTVALAAGPPRPAADLTRQVVGILEEVDFIHRTGRFRTCPGGECVEFVLTPEATLETLNADADLRDRPVGTAYEFTLHRDAEGRFTRAAVVRDRFTADTRAGMTSLPDAVNTISGTLRFSLLTQAAVSARQRQRYAAFVKARGLPARVERTEGKTLTLSLFGGEPATSEQTWPGDSSRAGRGVRVCVANDELRTWNPPVDHEWGKILDFHKNPTAGRSGARLVVTVNHLLEGFRRGRYVRVFREAWPLLDQPFGEQLFHYGAQAFPPDLAECPAKEYPDQHPFRTDHGNAHLPWYRLKPGITPPAGSEHQVFGELLAVSADQRSGRLRFDNGSDEVEFSLLPEATVRLLNAAVDLPEVPVGTRCLFHLYQDDAGVFRRASFVTDEVSELVKNGAVWRVESLNKENGTLIVAKQPPGVRNDQGDPEQPPDTGRALLRTSSATQIHKAEKLVDLAALVVGDLLLVNRTGDRPGHPSRCTNIWVGPDAHKKLPSARPRKPTPTRPKGTPR